MEEIVIIAGGMGFRLEEVHHDIPKTLLEIKGNTVLDYILQTIEYATRGKYRLLIAAGYYYEDLKNYVETGGSKYTKTEVIEAKEWKDGNAATLLAVKDLIQNEDFILQMSDHLFSTKTYEGCIKRKAIRPPFVCGQPKSDGIPDYLDLDDATRILSDDSNRIVDIGKEIPKWNMIDMGVFRLTKESFGVIESLPRNQKSLSQYVMKWRATRDFFVNPQPNAVWKDIDTPNDLQWAVEMDIQGMWKL